MAKKFVCILVFLISCLTSELSGFAETAKDAKAVNDSSMQTENQAKGKKSKAPPIPEELEDDLNCTKDMKYTEAQKKKLDEIYHKIYMDYLELIETYTAAGALTEDQKLVRYSMLKNYILTFAKRNYKWCSEWEEDEWEEEWFNIDRD